MEESTRDKRIYKKLTISIKAEMGKGENQRDTQGKNPDSIPLSLKRVLCTANQNPYL